MEKGIGRKEEKDKLRDSERKVKWTVTKGRMLDGEEDMGMRWNDLQKFFKRFKGRILKEGGGSVKG